MRRVTDANLAPAQEAANRLGGGGLADEVTPVLETEENHCWTGCYADTPAGRIAYVSPFRGNERVGRLSSDRSYYGVAILDHVVDFVLAVRGYVRASSPTRTR